MSHISSISLHKGKGGKELETIGQEERMNGKRAQSKQFNVHACVTGLSSTNYV